MNISNHKYCQRLYAVHYDATCDSYEGNLLYFFYCNVLIKGIGSTWANKGAEA